MMIPGTILWYKKNFIFFYQKLRNFCVSIIQTINKKVCSSYNIYERNMLGNNVCTVLIHFRNQTLNKLLL